MNSAEKIFTTTVNFWQQVAAQNSRLTLQASEMLFQNWQQALVQNDVIRKQTEQNVQAAFKGQAEVAAITTEALKSQAAIMTQQTERMLQQVGIA